MEQFYSILNNPEAIKEVMRKINEQHGEKSSPSILLIRSQSEEESRNSGRHHSRRISD